MSSANESGENPMDFVNRAKTWNSVFVDKFVTKILDEELNALQHQFHNNSAWKNPLMTTNASDANKGANKYYDTVPCQDQHRVVLHPPLNYIHANWIETPLSPKRAIGTQGPNWNTCDEFWQMIYQEKCEQILMLCEVYEQPMEKCHQYWPLEVGEAGVYGNIEIKNLESRPLSPDYENVVVTTFSLTHKDPDGVIETRNVSHYHHKTWPDQGVPEEFAAIMDVVEKVRSSQFSITVQCSAGIGRTGSVLGILMIMDKIHAGEEVESEMLIPELRSFRAMLIQTEGQYLFVFRCLLYYFIEVKKMYENDMDLHLKYNKFKADYRKVFHPSDDASDM